MRTFDEIYLLDLHGNSKKKERVPGTGEPDKNVFDIQQGVAIGIFIKRPPRAGKGEKPPARVFHADLWGAQRKTKYAWLDENHVDSTDWTELDPATPHYLFIPQNTRRLKEYERGWKVTEMMPVNNVGIVTARDHLTLGFSEKELWQRIHDFSSLPGDEARRRFNLPHDTQDWNVEAAQKDIVKTKCDRSRIVAFLYRPFDKRYTYYTGTANGFHCRPRGDVMRHMIQTSNIALASSRQTRNTWAVFSCDCIMGHKTVSAFDINAIFPLYLYPNGKLPEQDLFDHDNGRRPNLSAAFVKEFCEKLQVKFVPDGVGRPGKREIGPETIFHYAYAVFHSPVYRQRYAEFLRADFPRLPLTSKYELFRELAGFGADLVDLHARGKGEPQGICYPIKGDNIVEEVRYQPPQGREPGRVWINDRQYVEGVPEKAWTFPIGGYLPTQKWLKDRIGRTLRYDEQREYCRIVWALLETQRLMSAIEVGIEAHGGWPLT
jgi:predicted helicase